MFSSFLPPRTHFSRLSAALSDCRVTNLNPNRRGRRRFMKYDAIIYHSRSEVQFPLAPMGVLAPGVKNLKHFPINFLAISGDSKHFFQQKKLKNRPPGGHGGPPSFVLPQILFVCDLKPHAKFWNPTITPSGRKVSEAEEN